MRISGYNARATAEELADAVRALYRRNPKLTWSQLEVIVDNGVRIPHCARDSTDCGTDTIAYFVLRRAGP